MEEEHKTLDERIEKDLEELYNNGEIGSAVDLDGLVQKENEGFSFLTLTFLLFYVSHLHLHLPLLLLQSPLLNSLQISIPFFHFTNFSIPFSPNHKLLSLIA
jgi:hypothetical protein